LLELVVAVVALEVDQEVVEVLDLVVEVQVELQQVLVVVLVQEDKLQDLLIKDQAEVEKVLEEQEVLVVEVKVLLSLDIDTKTNFQ
jgi:hypothetical protein